MLVAIVDCIDETELKTLVTTLERDGFICLSCDQESIEDIHNNIRNWKSVPVLIYGARSIDLPYDDCERLWLGCGPQGYDERKDERFACMLEAWRASSDVSLAEFSANFDMDEHQESETFKEAVRRRDTALRSGFRLSCFVQATSFAATFLATQKFNIADSAAQDILLRHANVKKNKFTL